MSGSTCCMYGVFQKRARTSQGTIHLNRYNCTRFTPLLFCPRGQLAGALEVIQMTHRHLELSQGKFHSNPWTVFFHMPSAKAKSVRSGRWWRCGGRFKTDGQTRNPRTIRCETVLSKGAGNFHGGMTACKSIDQLCW